MQGRPGRRDIGAGGWTSCGAWNSPAAWVAGPYEVIDTKLARETKSGTILQVVPVFRPRGQGYRIWSPSGECTWLPLGQNSSPRAYRTGDYAAYYRLCEWPGWSRARWPVEARAIRDPKEHCGMCRWSLECDNRAASERSPLPGGRHLEPSNWRADRAGGGLQQRAWRRHLCLCSGYRNGARLSATRKSVNKPGFRWKAERKAVPSTRPSNPNRTSAWPCCRHHRRADIFFDFEGDPFVGPGGFEYLFGYLAANESDRPEYTGLWALSTAEEKRVFGGFRGTG